MLFLPIFVSSINPALARPKLAKKLPFLLLYL
jgi:hypothetical protein